MHIYMSIYHIHVCIVVHRPNFRIHILLKQYIAQTYTTRAHERTYARTNAHLAFENCYL